MTQNLKLISVFSGSKYYLKVPNGNELYLVKAVYYTRDVSGDMKIDYSESEKMQ